MTIQNLTATLIAKRDVAKARAEALADRGARERYGVRAEVYDEILELIGEVEEEHEPGCAVHGSSAAECTCGKAEREDPMRWSALSDRRDATPAEIAQEPDSVLEHLANGDLAATATTRRLASSELEYRRASRRSSG